MEAYQIHPFHQDVLAYMKTVIKTAVAIDYESDDYKSVGDKNA